MGRYMKRPVVIEARQLIGTPAEMFEVYRWLEEHLGSVRPDGETPGVTIDPADGCLVIQTLEGNMKAEVGDWIIRGVKGEFYPCKSHIFEATYDEVFG